MGTCLVRADGRRNRRWNCDRRRGDGNRWHRHGWDGRFHDRGSRDDDARHAATHHDESV